MFHSLIVLLKVICVQKARTKSTAACATQIFARARKRQRKGTHVLRVRDCTHSLTHTATQPLRPPPHTRELTVSQNELKEELRALIVWCECGGSYGFLFPSFENSDSTRFQHVIYLLPPHHTTLSCKCTNKSFNYRGSTQTVNQMFSTRLENACTRNPSTLN